MVGCKAPSVIEWRKRGVPADRCPTLERMSEGRFPCEEIRPDVIWVRVPDPAWRWHAAGRPLIDVTLPGRPASMRAVEVAEAGRVE